MPAGDSKLSQLATLRNRLIELDALLKEERKVTARLRDQIEKKNEQIAIVDAEIAAETERFRWKKEEVLFAIRNNERDAKGRIALMKYDERKFLEELAEFDLVQFNNERLHARLKEISTEHTQLTQSFFQEREAKKQKDFDTRMEMEEMLRKMIKSVDQGYQNDAVAKMQKEASQANIENERIHTEFSIREAKTEALIRQQQASYEQLMRTRIERDVMMVSTEMQEKNIVKMSRQNSTLDMQVQDLGRQVQRLRDEVTSLSTALSSKQELDDRCKLTLRQISEIEAATESWRKATLRLCKKLLRECHSIAEKGRIRGNAKITQRLDSLTNNGSQSVAEDATTAFETDIDADMPLSPIAMEDGDMDYDSMWRVPTGPVAEYRLMPNSPGGGGGHTMTKQGANYFSTGALIRTPVDMLRARAARTAAEVEGIKRKQSSPALLMSSAKMYKSFSV